MADIMSQSDALARGVTPTCDKGAFDCEGRMSNANSSCGPHLAATNLSTEQKDRKQVKRSWAEDVENYLSKKPNSLSNVPKFLIITSAENQLGKMSPFFIQKGLEGIGGSPKNVKKLRSGDLLIETVSPLQSSSFLSIKAIGHIPVTVYPHKSLNTSKGVISEIDLVSVTDSELAEELSNEGVIDAKRITLRKGNETINTKHVVLTFNSPNLPLTITAGYLKCSVRPYIPNPLRCFNCQRFGHSKTSCRGQETCSRCATVGHSFLNCVLDPKCVNCLGTHTSNSRSCPKWIQEKQIQTIKITDNISYPEARKKLMSTLPDQNKTYAAAVKPKTNSIQTQTIISIPPAQVIKLKDCIIENTDTSIKQDASTSTEIQTKPKQKHPKSSTKHPIQQKDKKKQIVYLKKTPDSIGMSEVSDSSESGEMEVEAGMESPSNLLPKSSKPKLQRPPKKK